MLTALHIENIAIISRLDLDFQEGFTVLTGETGAGKSIIIDAIGLLSGARGGRDVIRTGSDKASVSAVFDQLPQQLVALLVQMELSDAGDESVMLQRTVTTDGKSTARCNGRSISLSVLRQIAGQLIHIHGQNDNLQFLAQENHIHFLDGYAALGTLSETYAEQYTQMCSIKSQITQLHKSDREKARMEEMLRFEISDINRVKPVPGEEETLNTSRERLQNSEVIARNTEAIGQALRYGEEQSASMLLNGALDAMDQLKKMFPAVSEYRQRLLSCLYEIEDIADSVAALRGDLPTGNIDEALNDIETRLNEINRLKRKYGNDITEILAYRDECRQKLDLISDSEGRIQTLKKELKAVGVQALATAKEISQKRMSAATALADGIMAELSFLDMEKVRFCVQVEPDQDEKGNWIFNENGIDRVSFLISTNPGEPLKPIDRVASGGELSRVMLAAKCVLAGQGEQTMIFDEVDTGVSGKTSQKIGIKMRQLGHSGGQVLSVTHSAQIAALGDAHDLITKTVQDGRTVTKVSVLDENGRVEELARIMGGIHITDTIRKSAVEMRRNAVRDDTGDIKKT